MMDGYSLKHLDAAKDVTLNRFRQVLSNPGAQTKCWVIVEGEADNIAYSKFLNGKDKVVMKAGYTAKDNKEHGGKRAVQMIVRTALSEHWVTNIIGIIDKDYRDFEPTPSDLPQNIFCTDMRDLEMSMWYIIEIRESLVQYLSTTPRNVEWRLTKPKLDKTLEMCRYMGAIHVSNAWCGIHHQYEFKSYHYWVFRENIFVDDADWKKNMFDFYCCECQSMPEPKVFTQEMLDATIAHFDLDNKEIAEFGRGHDLMRILASVMIDTSSYSEKTMVQFMIDACTEDMFRTTRLYADIQAWQSTHAVEVVV